MSVASQVHTETSVPLTYSIAQASAHSGKYGAENILIDNSTDHTSRWSGSSQGNGDEWILLRLESLAVLKTVTFGKFHKPHPCNMKEFKIYVGTSRENMTEVLHAGLKNDSIPEIFHIKHANSAGICFPTRFVKIVPLSAHGQSFHTSIWHVSMTGIASETFVEQVRLKYDEYRETAAMRLVLKHLRQRRLLTPYECIISRSGFQLEHPLLTKLHEAVVLQGNWAEAEHLVSFISKTEMFDTYLHGKQPHAVWKRLRGTDADGDIPLPRGGHAMCIDPQSNLIYLFGGWDGQNSLDDFWAYDIGADQWRILSHSTSGEQNAPGARSCHKMVFDTKTGSIYLLGRLADSDELKANTTPDASGESTPPNSTFCSEFYRYHTRGMDSGKWDFLSFDTASSGGPPLVYDHQMVMDCEAQILYVFGGRVVDGDWDSVKYSGLYSYNVRTSKWKMLQHPDNSSTSQTIIPSRFGHSMVIEPNTQTLYIFAGQRDDKYLSDMYSYDIATNTATELYSNFSTAGGPEACFTQRAVLDPELREFYVLCGLTRSQHAGALTTLAAEAPNWMFSYSSCPGTWTQILPQPPAHQGPFTNDGDVVHAEEPQPRYAHQVVYNPHTKTLFMHGGNAGFAGEMERAGGGRGHEGRLDDLWQMTLARAGAEEVIRRATYQIRQQQFREMCEDSAPIKALSFLQTDVSAVVDHNDPSETDTFRSLLTYLLSPPSPSMKPTSPEAHDTPRKDQQITTAPDMDERWTDQLIEDESSDDTMSMHAVDPRALCAVQDPLEREVVEVTDSSLPQGKLTGVRFAQRNEVFENLLGFVSAEQKQPTGSLLDLIGMDGRGL